MRIWHVPFEELDNQRVLGQHNEIHALIGLIVKFGQTWGGLHKDIHQPYLYDVHERTVTEMRARKWTGHLTPVESVLPLFQGEMVLPEITPLRLEQDRWDLVLRWQGTYKGRVDMPSEYVSPLAKYKLQGGCYHSLTRIEEFKGGWRLCLLCKWYAFHITTPGQWVHRSTVKDVKITGRNPG
jgi:hypothetical protein